LVSVLVRHGAPLGLTRLLPGNFSRDEAADFLKGFADVLSLGDSMLIGLDACDDPAKV